MQQNNFYNEYEDAMPPSAMSPVENSGTFDLAGSYGRPKVNHVQTFGEKPAMRGLNEVAQALDILGIGPDDSAGRFNLAGETSLAKRRNDESRLSDYGLNFNLGDTQNYEKSRLRDLTHDEQFLLASNSNRGMKKYAAIDHFRDEDPLQVKP